MKGLFTSDWQADVMNLSLCRKAWKHVLSICHKEKLTFIAVCGDLKHAYNPVDIRVTKFWLWAIALAKKQRLRVIILLGNHDRIGMYTDAQNWLPILSKAGAECFDSPTVLDVGNGRLFLLPYHNNLIDIRESAKQLAEQNPDPKKDILVFHADLKGCRYNQTGKKSDGKLTVQDLHADHYRTCIGGHIHLHQQIGRKVWYTGSPFCTDWGEANQSKGFIVTETDSSSKVSTGFRFLPSPIPGWFDPTWSGFDSNRVGKGSRVRIHVQCSVSTDYGKRLEDARRHAERHWPGAHIYPVPEFEDSQRTDIAIKVTDKDEVKIKAYVDETLPQALEDERARIITYLCHRLAKVPNAQQRTTGGIKFIKAKAKNFLSFKKVELDFDQKGVVVVTGENKDWHGRSNGAGKTSLLQLIPVAHSGMTFKGQQYDRWARRSCSHTAEVSLHCTAGDKRIVIKRSRRPSTIKLKIAGVDQSSGVRGSDRTATQGHIEKATGFTWKTLANAVYIDQSVTHAFLSGTKKERTEVLTRFQNLERFESALQMVRADKSRLKASFELGRTWLHTNSARIEDCKSQIKAAQKDWSKHKAEVVSKYLAGKRVSKHVAEQLRKASHRFRLCEKQVKIQTKALRKKCNRHVRRKEELLIQHHDAHKIISAWQRSHSKICPTCYQNVDHKHLRKMAKRASAQATAIKKEILFRQRKIDLYEDKIDDLAGEVEQHHEAVEALLTKTSENTLKLSMLKRQINSDQYRAVVSVNKLKHKLRSLIKGHKMLKASQHVLEDREIMLDYCQEAFSRDGIPAFLNAQLCPILNKAAEYYARIFGDKQIQVRFEVHDGEFEPRILNASGGETIEDQSVGEKALAGLIASFALREVAPSCNLLVLDEPGDGLDAANARQFAQALPKLAKRFGTVFVTSHNVNILQELSKEHKISVVKRHGVSSIAV